MDTILKALFGKLPSVGDLFILRDSSPFDSDKYVITVIDVREGWVQFKSEYGEPRALTRSSFHFCYRALPVEARRDQLARGGVV